MRNRGGCFDVSIATGAAIAAAVALGFYAYFFGPNFSTKPEHWGWFGDYLGGVINPVVGIVTAFLVVRTLIVTRTEARESRIELRRQTASLRSQLRLARNDAKANDIRREIEGIRDDLVGYMNRNTYPHELNVWESGIADNHYVERILDHLLDDSDFRANLRSAAASDLCTNRVRCNWKTGFRGVIERLATLDDACRRYDEVVDGHAYTNYVRRGVSEYVELFSDLGIMHAELTGSLRAPSIKFPQVQLDDCPDART